VIGDTIPPIFWRPDFDLGNPATYSWPAANRDLQNLTAACHSNGLRVFIDSVMAFSNKTLIWPQRQGISLSSTRPRRPPIPMPIIPGGTGAGNIRDGFGSTLFRYAAPKDSYDPVSGFRANCYPARQLMKTAIIRWMNDFRIDGIRMDSIENIANWDLYRNTKTRPGNPGPISIHRTAATISSSSEKNCPNPWPY